jgi:transcriptional regulator of acetoin/glycerol metabolism
MSSMDSSSQLLSTLTFDKIADLCVRAQLTLSQAKEAIAKAYIRKQLVANKWNQCHAAKALGIHRNTLHRDIERLVLDQEIKKVKEQRHEKRRGRA